MSPTWQNFDVKLAAQTYLKAKKRAAQYSLFLLEDHLAPGEMREFACEVATLVPDSPQAQAVENCLSMETLGALDPDLVQGFVSYRLPGGALFYSNNSDRADKTLLVVFTGLKPRMGIPTPVFLQALDADRFDVLLLNDLKRAFFRRGIGDMDMALGDLPGWIEATFAASSYMRCVSIGISMGGGAALQVARIGRYERGIAVGLRESRPAFYLRDFRGQAPLDVLCECHADIPVPLVLVYGAANTTDAKTARHLQARVGCIRYRAAWTRAHNITYNAFINGYLVEFLTTLIDGDVGSGFQRADPRAKPRRMFIGWRYERLNWLVRLSQSAARFGKRPR